LAGEVTKSHALVTSIEGSSNTSGSSLWHQRYGRVNYVIFPYKQNPEWYLDCLGVEFWKTNVGVFMSHTSMPKAYWRGLEWLIVN
jgi:hypothetical protein